MTSSLPSCFDGMIIATFVTECLMLHLFAQTTVGNTVLLHTGIPLKQ